jgi:hypothetical protein
LEAERGERAIVRAALRYPARKHLWCMRLQVAGVNVLNPWHPLTES